MRQKCVDKRLCILMTAVFACLCVACQRALAADVHLGTMKASRILFLGNSLTYCPPNSDVQWTGNWGMAASSPEKDYAHLVTAAIAQMNSGSSPAMQAVNVYAYGGFEQNYAHYDAQAQLRTLLDWKPNILVVELGDNVTPSLTSQSARDAFANSLAGVLAAFKADSAPELFMTSTWWPNSTTDDILRRACADAHGVFVNIGRIGQDPLNVATSAGIYANDDVAAHPSDHGMQAIADSIVRAMVTHAIPEPGTLILLATAGLYFGGLGWIRNLSTRKEAKTTGTNGSTNAGLAIASADGGRISLPVRARCGSRI